MRKKALITGITGQDGSYLAELLLEKGYEVHGIVRRVAIENPCHRLNRIKHIINNIHLHHGTLENYSRFIEIFDDLHPMECYHLAAQSFVHESFEDGFSTMDMNIKGVQYVLSALIKKVPDCRFYFAASSEMFGRVQETPQKETTPFHPRSPYGISKVTGFHLTQNYRESYNLFACNGILFNHESPRRGFEFVTRKVTNGLARIKLGLEDSLFLGNLDAERDWGHAKDYVEAMWLMLQQDKPDDYVIGTGKKHTIREFLEKTIEYSGLKLQSNCKKGIEEKYLNESGKCVIGIDPIYFRPAEVNTLLADSSKARRKLGWKPSTDFDDLIDQMFESDLLLNSKEL